MSQRLRKRITWLVWAILADPKVNLMMGRLRHRYPETNWTTHAVYRETSVCMAAQAKLAVDLTTKGWVVDKSRGGPGGFFYTLSRGKSMISVSIRDLGLDVTVFTFTKKNGQKSIDHSG